MQLFNKRWIIFKEIEKLVNRISVLDEDTKQVRDVLIN